MELERTKLVSENTKLQRSITRLKRERNKARAVAEDLNTRLDGIEDTLNQVLIELETSKVEFKIAYQQGYDGGINVASKSYKAQMPALQDDIWATAWAACLTKAGVSETSPLWAENDLSSTMVIPEEEFVEEEGSLDTGLNVEVSEQTATGGVQGGEDDSNPGHKETSGGNNVESTAMEVNTVQATPAAVQDLTLEG